MHIERSRSSSSSARSRKEAAVAGRARGMRIGMAVSAYHEPITTAMREAAQKTFLEAGGAPDCLDIIEVPGAFELIAATNALAQCEHVDAIVTLGCIITGETTHDQYIAHAVANGIAQIIVETGVPIAFGVLTCQSIKQAKERAGGARGNKGEEAMLAAIESVHAIRSVWEHSGVAH